VIVPSGNYIHDFYGCHPLVLINDSVDMFSRKQFDLCQTEHIKTVTFTVKTFNL